MLSAGCVGGTDIIPLTRSTPPHFSCQQNCRRQAPGVLPGGSAENAVRAPQDDVYHATDMDHLVLMLFDLLWHRADGEERVSGAPMHP